jgi:centromeric protein E
MNYGEEHRSYRETNIHEHSSRSHTIFKVFIESKRNSDGISKFSCLNLIDLAGSERLNEFEMRGQSQMEETGHINKSLFILANVVNKLAEGKKNTYIPYRDSKLTRILRNALGGNSLSTMICTISPAAMNYHLTLSTLRFATRAKTVQNRPRINEVIEESMMANALRAELIKLKEELYKSQDEIAGQKSDNIELLDQLHSA